MGAVTSVKYSLDEVAPYLRHLGDIPKDESAVRAMRTVKLDGGKIQLVHRVGEHADVRAEVVQRHIPVYPISVRDGRSRKDSNVRDYVYPDEVDESGYA